jgi:inorganic pyrophosphatase/exopolyphosphatase
MVSLKEYINKLNTLTQQNTLLESIDGYVIGNSGADLDSFVCSFVVACFLTEIYEWKKIHYPVFSIDKNQFHYRTDIQLFLKSVSKKPISLHNDPFWFCKDSLLCSPLFTKCSLQHIPEITLVDHDTSSLHPDYNSWVSKAVVRVIDHHGDHSISTSLTKSHLVCWDTKEKLFCCGSSRIGSCATLVTFLVCQSLIAQKTYHISNDLCQMLLMAILKDTSNFRKENRNIKWCDLDTEAFDMLLCQSSKTVSIVRLLETLKKMKKSIAQVLYTLDVRDLLRYDSKIFIYNTWKVFYSSFPVSISSLLTHLQKRHINFLADFDQFVQAECLDSLILLSSPIKKTNSFKIKELVLFFPTEISLLFKRTLKIHNNVSYLLSENLVSKLLQQTSLQLESVHVTYHCLASTSQHRFFFFQTVSLKKKMIVIFFSLYFYSIAE